MKFTLEIELGNAAMSDYLDIATAVGSVFNRLHALHAQGEDTQRYASGPIRDVNGNSVGQWAIEG